MTVCGRFVPYYVLISQLIEYLKVQMYDKLIIRVHVLLLRNPVFFSKNVIQNLSLRRKKILINKLPKHLRCLHNYIFNKFKLILI